MLAEDKLNYLELSIPTTPVPVVAGQSPMKSEEGQSVSSYVLKMKGYIDNLERLGHPVSLNLAVSLILVSLRKEYDSFVQNYNMHSMGKTERSRRKTKNKKPQLAARGNNKRKWKSKHAYAPKPKIPPPPKKEDPAKDSNKKLPQGASTSGIFTIELFTFPGKSLLYDTGCGTHICNSTQGFRRSRKLKPGALSLYMGNGQRAAVEAIRPYDLCSPICKDNVIYFNIVPRDGIFEIDLSNSNTNDCSMYAVSNKRAKLNLDSSLSWHCRLGHISKKRIEKLQHDGLLNSIDFVSFEKCVPCLFVKMARKPYSHQVKRAKDLLGLIHTDDPEFDKRLKVMNVEMQSMKDNKVWDLVDLSPNGKTVGSKWLFKKKTDMDGAVQTYKARLVAKGFTQTPGIDYEEIFSPVADVRANRILIAIVVSYDYEI
ncbi:retrotransposon protein, putative, ty1-copia subclass [Tanacetum coccineum]